MKFTESTWSPFQSSEVRDICAHLTPAEKQHLLVLAAQYGRDSGWRFAVPFALVLISFPYSRLVGLVLLVCFITYCATLAQQRVRAHQRRVREFLCATGYARERGYTPDSLRMFALPWSR
jgi:hypothetical protein